MKKFWIVAAALCLLLTATLGILSVSAGGIVYGDADGNGKVNNRDLGLLQLYLNDGDLTDKAFVLAACDLDGNGKINNRDLGLLQKQLNQ